METNESKTGLCPDCGGVVSKLADRCPHCGRPLTAEEIEEDPKSKAWYDRTVADNEKIRNATGGDGKKQGGAGTFIAVVLGIIVAVWLLSQLFTVQVTGTITPLK